MPGRAASSMRLALLAGVCAIVPLMSGCGGGGGSSGNPAPTGPPGALDPSFGSGGVVITSTGGDAQPDAVLVQPDGIIVVVGSNQAPGASGTQMLLVRYTAGGVLDAGKVAPFHQRVQSLKTSHPLRSDRHPQRGTTGPRSFTE